MTKLLPVIILVVLGAGVVGLTILLSEPQSDKVKVNSTIDKNPSAQNSPTSITASPTLQSTPANMEFDTKKKYQVTLDTTAGKIVVELSNKTPVTSNNFLTLAKKKFYDGTIFHRVISGFMIQGGDPKGDGTGGPGYKFADEPFEGEYTRGTVAMANAGPNTNGSQFFIMHADYPLPKNYVIFGKVVTGLEVVDKIASAPVTRSPSGENSKPVEPVKVTSVELAEIKI